MACRARLIPAVPVQQDGRDLPPFLIGRSVGMGLVRTLVPVSRVFRVPFPAMQVGVDPSRLLTCLLILGDVVSAVKISLGIPPKSLQQRRQARRGTPSRKEARNSSIVMAAFYARAGPSGFCPADKPLETPGLPVSTHR